MKNRMLIDNVEGNALILSLMDAMGARSCLPCEAKKSPITSGEISNPCYFSEAFSLTRPRCLFDPR